MSYPYVQGIDYGPRDGTLGLSFHMSEGGDGLVGYLARHAGEDLHQWAGRVSGVSCNVALLSTGEIVRMLPWDHASGNDNPDDRAGEYGYFGHQHLVDVLGDHWPDPNTWTLSMEIAGYRANGPTDKQVAAAIAWGLEMRSMFPTLRGAVGHHDQSPKGCPGTTAAMKAIFAGVGGHGLFPPKEATVRNFEITGPSGTITVKSDAQHWAPTLDGVSPNPKLAGGQKIANALPIHLAVRVAGGLATANRSDGYLVVLSGLACIVLAMDATFAVPADASPFTQADIDRAQAAVKAKAVAAVGGI